ncbi:MAG TPA: hypothetical protein PLP29_14340 [Candidatus Ozemobacteraceae bacterium]|nr:hypothetical protein [Candidatus Ozemobacteraceae bacterium]
MIFSRASAFTRFVTALCAVAMVVLLMGATPKAGAAKKKVTKTAKTRVVKKKKAQVARDEHAPAKDPPRRHQNDVPRGRPWYESMFGDSVLRIAVFWGWDHPREAVEATFPAFETLNGKYVYYRGRKARIEIGVITQVSPNPKALFKAALEDPSIDVVIYSGHARYGGGMAFSDRDDLFRSGNGEMIEDRHTKPYKYFRASSEDLDETMFPNSYRIIMLNCCDSEAHFRESWSRRLKETGAVADLVLVEYPVFNLYDNRRVLNFIQDLLSFSDWKRVKNRYDSEVHKRRNSLVVQPVFVPEETPVTREAGPEEDEEAAIEAEAAVTPVGEEEGAGSTELASVRP